MGQLLYVQLADRHRVFADNYIRTGRISESAKRAECPPKSAHVTGNKWLKRPDIQQYIAQRTEQLSAEVQESTEEAEPLALRIQRELEKMAFANLSKFIRIENGQPVVDLSTATEDDIAALTKASTKITKRYDSKGAHIATEEQSDVVMADKYKGLELLGKTVGMFKSDETRVIVDVADRLLRARGRLGVEDRMRLGGGGG